MLRIAGLLVLWLFLQPILANDVDNNNNNNTRSGGGVSLEIENVPKVINRARAVDFRHCFFQFKINLAQKSSSIWIHMSVGTIQILFKFLYNSSFKVFETWGLSCLEPWHLN